MLEGGRTVLLKDFSAQEVAKATGGTLKISRHSGLPFTMEYPGIDSRLFLENFLKARASGWMRPTFSAAIVWKTVIGRYFHDGSMRYETAVIFGDEGVAFVSSQKNQKTIDGLYIENGGGWELFTKPATRFSSQIRDAVILAQQSPIPWLGK